MQEALKERVRKWLKAQRQSREWLAEKCGVEKRTVDNWLSSPRDIPQKALLIIEGLIAGQESEPSTTSSLDNVVVIHVNDEQFEAYNRASMSEGKTIKEWILSILDGTAIADSKSSHLSDAEIIGMAAELQDRDRRSPTDSHE